MLTFDGRGTVGDAVVAVAVQQLLVVAAVAGARRVKVFQVAPVEVLDAGAVAQGRRAVHEAAELAEEVVGGRGRRAAAAAVADDAVGERRERARRHRRRRGRARVRVDSVVRGLAWNMTNAT